MSLAAEFREYAINENLPQDADALELLMSNEITHEQRIALEDFSLRWEVATEEQRWGVKPDPVS